MSKLEKARDLINTKFVYKSDNALDVWEVLDIDEKTISGDCEDYSLTFIWLAEDRNFFKFIWALFIMKYVIWYVKSPRGGGHVVTYISSTNLYIDNIKKDFYTRQQYRDDGFKFVFPFISVLAFVKLIISYTIGRFFK